jgi:hypothetical protein
MSYPHQSDDTLGQYGVPQYGSFQPQPPDYRGWIVAAAVGGVLFSLLFGLGASLVALHSSRNVRSRWSAGNMIGAEQASRTARGWVIAATALDVIGLILVFVLLSHGTQPSS